MGHTVSTYWILLKPRAIIWLLRSMCQLVVSLDVLSNPGQNLGVLLDGLAPANLLTFAFWLPVLTLTRS